jgi:hypothetical protein
MFRNRTSSPAEKSLIVFSSTAGSLDPRPRGFNLHESEAEYGAKKNWTCLQINIVKIVYAIY